ncbi:Protein of unknown function [Bacillus thuringiensis]|uniref:Uncharacterized protein n=1 Tax=Bacillus thuringiensis TaxID=1428 RepID=A0A1C4D4G4_BACTU|nr:Protein of unknown function [Bacillus thuringiensis]SCN07858.1 Protein of unknown function [Bacillus wiedmannii]
MLEKPMFIHNGYCIS